MKRLIFLSLLSVMLVGCTITPTIEASQSDSLSQPSTEVTTETPTVTTPTITTPTVTTPTITTPTETPTITTPTETPTITTPSEEPTTGEPSEEPNEPQNGMTSEVVKSEDLKYINTDSNNSMGYFSLPTTGNQKVLVVPVQFSGSPAWSDSMTTRLEKAFFGTQTDIGWESVKTYYNESSSGKLNISGELTDPLVLSITAQSAASSYGGDTVEDYVISSFYSTASTTLLNEYDQDNDGLVDATMFIYSNDYKGSGRGYSDAFWAWVWYLNNPSSSKPTVGTYMWASYEFLNDETNLEIDTHTLIHEFGHVLGLDDYYTYDSNGWDPVGTLEMQSYNTGDQGAYSKLTNGWNDITYINGEKANSGDKIAVEIDTTALKDGDIILINDSWNGHALDEYILVEYYTPQGLNEWATTSENTTYGNMYTESGLRIYHVDARLVKLNSSGRFVSYSDEIYNDSYTYFPGASNSYSWSYLDSPDSYDFKLNHLMQADVTSSSDSDHFENGGTASNSTLYNVGDKFAASSIFFSEGTKFNDGSEVGYSVEMLSKTTNTATVEIEKL